MWSESSPSFGPGTGNCILNMPQFVGVHGWQVSGGACVGSGLDQLQNSEPAGNSALVFGLVPTSVPTYCDKLNN